MGGGANAPPYGIYPNSANNVSRDPHTGKGSDASSGLSGLYDSAVGGDEEDDFLGENGRNNLYSGYNSKVRELAGYGIEAGELAASFNPGMNAVMAASGRSASGKRKLNGWERAGAGLSALPAGAMEGVVAGAAKGVARGAGAIAQRLRSTRRLFPDPSKGIARVTEDLIRKIKSKRDVDVVPMNSQEARVNYLDKDSTATWDGEKITILDSENRLRKWMEEFLHGTQDKSSKLSLLGRFEQEKKVREFMIRHQRMLGLGDADILVLRAELRHLREMYPEY